MMADGINFNKTICNVIIKKNGNEGDLEAKALAFNAQKESKNTISITTAEADSDLQEVAMEKVSEALTKVEEYKKSRRKTIEKKAKTV